MNDGREHGTDDRETLAEGAHWPADFRDFRRARGAYLRALARQSEIARLEEAWRTPAVEGADAD